MTGMTLPDHYRELLEELKNVQARPITDAALIERMRTEATRWINAVHMQHRRLSEPVFGSDLPGPGWRQEIDLHFLLVGLTRLRRAVGLASRVALLQQALLSRIAEFDDRVPYLSRLRNAGEHFDDYTTGNGRDRRIKRAQLQMWSLDSDPEDQLTWRWLGEEATIAEVHAAATDLYRGFLIDAERYLTAPRGQEAVH